MRSLHLPSDETHLLELEKGVIARTRRPPPTSALRDLTTPTTPATLAIALVWLPRRCCS